MHNIVMNRYGLVVTTFNRERSIDAALKNSRFIAFIATIALTACLLLAAVKQEYLIENGAFIWNSPLFLYAAIGIYSFCVFLYCYRIFKGQLLAGAFLLCPAIAFDISSRILFQPILPAASFVIVAAVGVFGVLIYQKPKLNGPTIIFTLLAGTYFVVWGIRDDVSISNADIQYLSFALTLFYFSNVANDIDQAKEVMITIAYFMAISLIPFIWIFFNMFVSNVYDHRFCDPSIAGANTLAVNIGLGVLILYLIPSNRHKMIGFLNIGISLFLFIALLLTGSRGQIYVVIAIVSLFLLLEKRFLILFLIIFITVTIFFYIDIYAIQRVLFFDTTLNNRVDNYAHAIEIIQNHLWFGIGPHAWNEISYYANNAIKPVHNPVLAIFVDGGLLCGLLNILFIISIIRIGIIYIAKNNPLIKSIGWILISSFLIQFTAFYYSYLPFAIIGLCLTPLHQQQFSRKLIVGGNIFSNIRKLRFESHMGTCNSTVDANLS